MKVRHPLSVGVMGRTQMVRPSENNTSFSLVNFSISTERLSPLALMDSTFGSPARYAAEMLRRLRRHTPGDAYLVINPRFDFSPGAVDALVVAARHAPPELDFVLFTEAQGRVASMLLRRPVADEDTLMLSALSANDAAVDQNFLQAAFGWKGRTVALPHVDGGAVDGNGFLLGSYSPRALALPATLGLEALARARAESADLAEARRKLLHVAVLPWHAGDILFLCQAVQALQDVGAVLVLRDFAPIVRECLPWVRVVAVDAAMPMRYGFHVADEHGFMAELIKRARADAARTGEPLDGIFHLLRPHRDYARSHFHLRQALWFALGGDASSEIEAEVWPQPRAQRRSARCTANRRERVVVHFDGGWSLKSYPRSMRQPLLSLLRGAGFRPVVLGSEEPGLFDCDFVPFKDLAGFRALLDDSAALIGPDSFPAHYAVHRGVPTLHLFASTHPRNSDFPTSSLSRTLHVPLPCVPCGEQTNCKIDGSSGCRAAPPPHMVLENLLQLVGPPSRDAELGEVYDPEARLRLEVALASRRPLPPPGKVRSVEVRQQLSESLARDFDYEDVPLCPMCGGAARREVGEKLGVLMVTCEGCGLWYGSRRVREEQLGRLYSGEYWLRMQVTHGQPTGPERYGFDYDHALERVAWVKRFVQGGRSLDVGCGYAAFARRLSEHGFEAEGLDFPAVAAAARRYSGVRVHTSLAAEPRYDLVTAFDVVEHLYHPREGVAGLTSRVRPGGVFVFETFRTDCAEFERQGLDHEDVKPLEHPHGFREAHLRALVEEAGLQVLDVLYPDGVERARIRVAARRPA